METGLVLGDELRLLYAILLNVLALWAGWRLGRRWNDSRIDAARDALLVYYLIQYVSICVPGVLGALHPLTIGATTAISAGAIGLAARTRERETKPLVPTRDAIVAIGAPAFVFCYVIALVWHQRPAPVMSNDAITYHLPAAVQWLQTGRLGLYEAWFYNPANSYSPLGGSVFIAWWLAPFGNDVIARFVQVGPLAVLFVALLNLCRRLGADVGVAALIAAAAVMTRSFISQSVLAKDDLFVAAFFVLAVDALGRERLEQRIGAWRAGVAIGLLLATKYTVLFSVPLLLLMINRAWTWRRIAIIALCMALLAGPWYLRNLLLTGNPLYPTELKIAGVTLLPGMLQVQRSEYLETLSGVWKVFTGYYGTTPIVAGVLIVGWIGGVVAAFRRIRADALVRTCLVGPPIGIALFVLTAPYGEMRFAYPSIVLMYAAMAVGLSRLPWIAQVAVGASMVIVAGATAFAPFIARPLTLIGLGGAAIGIAAVAVDRYVPTVRKFAPYGVVAVVLAVGMYGYVNWSGYVKDVEASSTISWAYPPPDAYGEIAHAWAYVRNEIPRGATIAYANTYFVYPLMGYRYDHRVVYAPTRGDLGRFVDMPAIERKLTGEEIVAEMVAMLRESWDREQWLRRLRQSGAEYLFIAKEIAAHGFEGTAPPEIGFVQGDKRVVRVFDNDAASVFKINW